MKKTPPLKYIVNNSIKLLLKDAGFKKTRFRFHRRRGSVVQVIMIRGSHYGMGSGDFYVDVNLAFDKLQEVDRKNLSKRFKGRETEMPGPDTPIIDFLKSLNRLVPDTPHYWLVSPENIDHIANELASKVKLLISNLDRINSIPSFLSMKWLGVGSDYLLAARLYYAVGDLESAAKYAHLAADFFCDRPDKSFADIVNRYELYELEKSA
jgi:hypothetical protein